jgi:hypothetical protein
MRDTTSPTPAHTPAHRTPWHSQTNKHHMPVDIQFQGLDDNEGEEEGLTQHAVRWN